MYVLVKRMRSPSGQYNNEDMKATFHKLMQNTIEATKTPNYRNLSCGLIPETYMEEKYIKAKDTPTDLQMARTLGKPSADPAAIAYS